MEIQSMVDIYKDNNLLHTIQKNDYRTEGDEFILLEWFELSDGKVVYIFNKEHSVISVIDADTGTEINNSFMSDVFISEYQMFDDREYMYISGWIWTPFPCRCIYHIPTLLTTPNYEPIYIPCYDQVGNMRPKISLFGCKTCKEFIEKHTEIFENILISEETALYNQNRSKPTLLRFFLNDSTVIFERDSKTKLEELLDTPQERFYIRSWGNTSREYLGLYDTSLYNELLYIEDKPRAVINFNVSNLKACAVCNKEKGSYYYIDGFNVCNDDYTMDIKKRDSIILSKLSKEDPIAILAPKVFFRGSTTKLPIEEINIRFEITYDTGSLYVNYYQSLTWDGEELKEYDYFRKRCYIDLNKPPKIVISCRHHQ
jgi:hypothetical protein